MKKHLVRLHIAVALVFGITLSQCKTSEPVADKDPRAPAVAWDQTDARTQLRSASEGLLNADWVHDYYEAHRGKRPRIMVANMRNTTGQYLNTLQLQTELERFMIRGGRVTVINGHATADTSRQAPALPVSELQDLARRFDAEFLLITNLSGRAAPGMPHLTNYLLNLEVMDMREGTPVWSDSKAIRRNETVRTE